MTNRQARFEVFKSTRGATKDQFYWRLRARNGKIVAQSEGYNLKRDAMDTITAIKLNAANALIIDLERDEE